MSHYNPMRYQLWKYETFVELANSLRYKNDPFSMTIFVYLFTFCMTIESMIYLRPQHTYSWDMFNDYVIYNYQLYCESIRSKVETRRLIKLIHHKQLQLLQYKYSRFIPNMILNMMAWFRTQGIAKRKHLNVDLERFHSKPLRMFPSMSLQLRLKYVDLYRYVEMNDLSIYDSNLFNLDLSVNLFETYYFMKLNMNQFSSKLIPYFLIDHIIYAYIFIRLIKLALIVAWSALFACVFYSNSLIESNDILDRNVRIACKQNQFGISIKFEQILWKFIQVHTKISYIIRKVNQEIWGDVLLCSLICNIPCHFNNEIDSKQLLSWLIMTLQTIIIIGCLKLLANASKTIHCCKRLMNQLQMIIEPRSLILKWKYMLFYERIANRKNKYGITIGPTSALTNRTILKKMYEFSLKKKY
ncbi:hypothetical protein BLOT_015847 [Blomia tropicalis]|nr:hypothetical protein BLOT_015847 [Blomia tropicalis]